MLRAFTEKRELAKDALRFFSEAIHNRVGGSAEEHAEKARKARIEAVLAEKCFQTSDKPHISWADKPASGPPSPLVEETAHPPVWDPFDVRKEGRKAPHTTISYAEQLELIVKHFSETPLQNWSLTERLFWLLKQDVVMILVATSGFLLVSIFWLVYRDDLVGD
jgi:hypothetical protein